MPPDPKLIEEANHLADGCPDLIAVFGRQTVFDAMLETVTESALEASLPETEPSLSRLAIRLKVDRGTVAHLRDTDPTRWRHVETEGGYSVVKASLLLKFRKLEKDPATPDCILERLREIFD